MRSFLLECIDCGNHVVPTEADYLCPKCAGSRKPMQPLRGLLRCLYDHKDVMKRRRDKKFPDNSYAGLARWWPLLPLRSPDSIPSLIVNTTPMRPAERLRAELGLSNLWLKDDTVSPTASFKDRASALVVAVARELGKKTVATASTGNAATALAGFGAAVGMETVIFVPASAPKAKLAQIAVFGARLVPVDAGYDACFELSIEACEAFGWYNRSTAYNPFTIEGKKTAALEIWEQLKYTAPDWVIVPTGDGVIAAGIEAGFSDLMRMRLIDRIPRLAIVQAAGCAPIVRTFEERGTEIEPERRPDTFADSIAVGVPRAGRWVIAALAKTNGVAVAVEDSQISEAINLLGRTTGVFAEPAAAASIAGLCKLVSMGTIKSDEKVVALITGSGLKDVPAAMRTFEMPKAIAPELKEVQRLFR